MARVFFDRADRESEVLYGQSYCDLAELKSAERTDKGFLRVQGRITRSGVFKYLLPDGTPVKMLRPPDEVFSLDSLRSFELAPITIEHPVVNGKRTILTPDVAKQYSVGSISLPRRVGNHAVADMLITDAKAIALAEGGMRKLSAGYSADVWLQSGRFVDDEGATFEFEAVQRNIRGNHVAITDTPRLGPTSEFKFDGGVYDGESEAMKTRKIKINGIEVELEDSKATEIEAAQAKETKVPVVDSADALKRENSELRGQIAAMSSQAADKGKADEGKTKLKQRMVLVSTVASAIGLDSEKDESKRDAAMDALLEMEPIDLMKRVIEAKSTIDVADSTDEAYVRGVFTALTKAPDASAATSKARKSESKDNGLLDALRAKKPKAADLADEDEESTLQAAYSRTIKESSEAWKTGLYPESKAE